MPLLGTHRRHAPATPTVQLYITMILTAQSAGRAGTFFCAIGNYKRAQGRPCMPRTPYQER
jgi:hypothetical protein